MFENPYAQSLQDQIGQFSRLLADKSNADQSAYLLSVMGRWVANPSAVAI